MCVYDEHPLAGRDIQYGAPDSWSRYTTPFDKIKKYHIKHINFRHKLESIKFFNVAWVKAKSVRMDLLDLEGIWGFIWYCRHYCLFLSEYCVINRCFVGGDKVNK